jgi:hypothetical protein
MTLAVLAPPDTGQSRITAAEELLRQAMVLLHREQRDREKRQRQFTIRPFDEREKAAMRRAELQRIKQEHMISVDRRWFWDFANAALDEMRSASHEAKKHGEQMRAQGIDATVDMLCEQLDLIQQRQARGAGQ